MRLSIRQWPTFSLTKLTLSSAHKAAYPEKYPVLPSALLLCPHLKGVQKQHKKPTSVHLQVYDGKIHYKASQDFHLLTRLQGHPIFFLFFSPLQLLRNFVSVPLPISTDW